MSAPLFDTTPLATAEARTVKALDRERMSLNLSSKLHSTKPQAEPIGLFAQQQEELQFTPSNNITDAATHYNSGGRAPGLDAETGWPILTLCGTHADGQHSDTPTCEHCKEMLRIRAQQRMKTTARHARRTTRKRSYAC